MLRPTPSAPLMVCYYGPLTTCSNIGDACKMTHKENVPELGCLMLAKNRPEIILDDGKVDDIRSDYFGGPSRRLSSLRRGSSFHVEPYGPHRFSR